MKQMQKIEIMLKQFVKHFSLCLLICLICNNAFAQAKQSKYILNEWAHSNIILSNSKSFDFYKKKLIRFIPKGYKIDLLYKGLLSSDKVYDFCIILIKEDVTPMSDEWATNDRPLIVIINNKYIFRNNGIISPHYVSKGNCGIVMKKGNLYILSHICSEASYNCLFAEVFKYNKRNKIIFDRYSEFNEKSNHWYNIIGKEKKGLPFQIYKNY